jgi:hypothetical protein
MRLINVRVVKYTYKTNSKLRLKTNKVHYKYGQYAKYSKQKISIMYCIH